MYASSLHFVKLKHVHFLKNNIERKIFSRSFVTPSSSVSSTAYKVDPDYLIPKSIIPTYHFQKSLPRLPIPSLQDSCQLYLNCVQPILSETQFKETQKNVQQFLGREGQKLHSQLVEQDKNNKHTSYISGPWYDMYLRGRYSVAINSNPFMVFNSFPKPEQNTQLARATTLIKSSLKFKRSLEEQVLEPEIFHVGKGFPSDFQKKLIALTPQSLSWYHAYLYNSYALDMSQYSSLFGTTRIPKPEKDEILTSGGQRHILVMRGPHMYSVEVLNPNGTAKSMEEIQASLAFILQDPEAIQPGPAIGALTAEERTTWANIRALLEKNPTNKTSLQTIDKALFVVCLDDWESNSQEFIHHQFLHGNGVNRNFDKSLSLLVSKDGRVAVNFEHSWGDGVAVLRYVNEVYRDALNSPLPGTNVPEITKPTKLTWNINSEIQQAIDNAKNKIQSVISSLEFKVGDFTKYGKDYLKSKKVSPDGTIQMAYQLAYNKMYGKTVATYESASTAGFLHGRTETIRPASMDSVAFVKAFLDPKASVEDRASKLRKAIDTHSSYTRKALMGKGFDRHLFALLHLAKAQSGPLPDIFKDEAYNLINHNILSTSTLVSEAIQGGGFGPVVEDGYGIGYGVDPKGTGVRFNITSYHRNTETFIDHIKQSLVEIQQVLDASKQPQSK